MPERRPTPPALIPAHAGVILRSFSRLLRACSYPRARGGDPFWHDDAQVASDLSPRTRG